VLLKAIAQAIPSYVMFVFKISHEICRGIISGMSKYRCGDGANQKMMHLLAWWKTCVPNKQGEINF
jgi:hypothetical protein